MEKLTNEMANEKKTEYGNNNYAEKIIYEKK